MIAHEEKDICQFTTVLCVDGSANDPGKRPVYRIEPDLHQKTVYRCTHADGVLSVIKEDVANEQSNRPQVNADAEKRKRRTLITADVPIGLPTDFPEVYQDFDGFVSWLFAENRNWQQMVCTSIGEQKGEQPFVTCKKGEKKLTGKFPLRQCDKLAKAESVYWCLGPKQVGKAALQFWRETLVPLKAHFGDRLAVWPFQKIEDRHDVVVAECYPASFIMSVWNRRVKKTDALDRVAALDARRASLLELCDIKTLLHAASSEDEFDMFTTAVALAEALRSKKDVLAFPQLAVPFEGWMLLLPDAPVVAS